MTSITICSDLHGHQPKLSKSDILILPGDLTANNSIEEFELFDEWLKHLDFEYKIIVPGNHDGTLENNSYHIKNGIYLCDSGIKVKNINIYGSPWTSRFPGMNLKCCAFTQPYGVSLKEHWDKIPDDVDILVTHAPPYGILDQVIKDYGENISVGDRDLRKALEERIRPKLHVFGHINEPGGQTLILKRSDDKTNTICVNCSHVNERYKPVNKPVRIIL